MKRGLMTAVMLLILLVSVPAMALTVDEAQNMATKVGCPARVEFTTDPNTPFNGYFGRSYDGLVIVMVNPETLPDSWAKLIFWHEVGHCKQYMEWGFPDGHEREWDPDAFAIKMLAEEGLDGADLNAEVWAYVNRRYGYTGSDENVHGLVVHRIVRGWLNRTFYRLEAA